MTIVKGKAVVQISRRTNGNNPDLVTIMIQDENSRSQVEAFLTLEQFGLVVMGCYFDGATAEWHNPELLGFVRETKTVYVTWSGSFRTTPQQRQEAISLYETEGWKGRAEDLDNDHNRRGNGTYAVGFVRWVKL